LAPAVISKVIIDQTKRSMEVIVPDDQLSLAIGKRGQNVRLASKLTGWHIDVKSESKYQKAIQDGYQSLLALPGIGEATADHLYEAGFTSAEELASAQIEEIAAIPGISQQKAETFTQAAKDYLAARQNGGADADQEKAEIVESSREEA
jgi:N utilization substance protein A